MHLNCWSCVFFIASYTGLNSGSQSFMFTQNLSAWPYLLMELVKIGPYWIRVAPSSITGVLIREKLEDTQKKHGEKPWRQKRHREQRPCEGGGTRDQSHPAISKDCKGLSGVPEVESDKERFFPGIFRENLALNLLPSGFQTLNL